MSEQKLWAKPDDIYGSCPRCGRSGYVDHYPGLRQDENGDVPDRCCRYCGQVWCSWHDEGDLGDGETSINEMRCDWGWKEDNLILPCFTVVVTTYQDYPVNEHYTFRETTWTYQDGHVSHSYTAWCDGELKGSGLCGRYLSDGSHIADTDPLDEYWPRIRTNGWRGLPSDAELPEPVPVADGKAPPTLHPMAKRWVEVDVMIFTSSTTETIKAKLHITAAQAEDVKRGRFAMEVVRGDSE